MKNELIGICAGSAQAEKKGRIRGRKRKRGERNRGKERQEEKLEAMYLQ